MTLAQWRDRPAIVEHPERWGPFALYCIGVGTLASGVVIVGTVAATGGFMFAPVFPTILAFIVGFLVSAVSSSLIVLTAVGFARVAERASTVVGRAAIIAGGVAGGVGVVVLPPTLAIYGQGPTVGLTALVIVGTALALAGGALAPWRYGFARPIDPAASEHSGVR